jgi:methyl-accepting chemotaxis protein
MSNAQRVGNVYFAQFGGGGTPQGVRSTGFEHTMAEIRRAIDSIGDVSRLIGDDNRKLARLCNDSSQRISQVLGIIEGVALDSNLVALNAALEASREDQGRYDIALVAAEIRTLLNRSECATRELHALLSDTVHKVEAGALLVEEVGLTLARSAGAVRQVTEILTEIGSSPAAAANAALLADVGAD